MYKTGSKVVILTCFCLTMMVHTSVIAQSLGIIEMGGISPNSVGASLDNRIVDEALIDQNWGVLPSQQGSNIDMWGQRIERSNGIQPPSQLLDIHGNPVLVDNNGNIVYDAQGNAVVDSIALNSINNNVSNNINPPDDPLDVPLDGGVALLLTIATFFGYTNTKKK
jgi:hypothetical protein